MAIPRKDSRLPERVKKLEDAIRWIRLLPSVILSDTQPTEVVKNSTWYDSGSGNEPKYWDGSAWVPVRDETIAVAQTTADTAQTTADTAQTTAVSAAADAAAAQAAALALQTDLDAAEAAVAAAQADIDTLNTTTLPAMQTELDAAEADVATLTGTTIPGLAADIAAAQAEVDGILPITETDISDDAITTPKLAAGAITAVKIAANTITAAQIAADAITASELAANAVTAGKIAAGTIVAADIASGTITATQIAANTITAAKIAAGTITATEIQAGAITSTKLSADAIDGKTITGTWLRTAASGARLGFNDPTYPGEIVLYTDAPEEIEPARIKPILSGGVSYLQVIGPRSDLVAAPPTLNLSTNNVSDSTSIELDCDLYRLFATDTKITGFGPTGVQIGDGTDDVSFIGNVVKDADLTDASNTFLGRMLTQNLAAACSSNLVLQTTEADVPGATVTFSTTRPNARYMVIGTFYFASTASNNNVAHGKLSVDGTVQSAWAEFTGSNTVPDRVTASQTWTGTLAAAGSHTLKLRGVHANANNVVTVNASHTTIVVMVFE